MTLESSEGQDFPQVQTLTLMVTELSTISLEAALSYSSATPLFNS